MLLTSLSINTSSRQPDLVSDIAIVIPSLNGARLRSTCLESLRIQTRAPDEIVVVDDGSTDDTLAFLEANFPEVRVVSHKKTRGVATAFNDGIRATKSSIVVLLNNDTEAESTWLAELCRPLDIDAQCSWCASKLLLFDRRDVLHSAGDFFSRDGMPGNRGVWQIDRGQFDRHASVFGPCGAAAAYRRSSLDEVGYFDESLGSYCEDVDLSFRSMLQGHCGVFVPTARVYHRLSATGGGSTASYFVGRNAIWVLAQNVPGALLARYWPRILARQVAIAREAAVHWREPAARARLRGQIDGLRGLAGRLHRRRALQSRRQISIAAIDAALSC